MNRIIDLKKKSVPETPPTLSVQPVSPPRKGVPSAVPEKKLDHGIAWYAPSSYAPAHPWVPAIVQAGLIGLAVAVWIIRQDILFPVFLVFASLVLMFQKRKKSSPLPIALTDAAIVINGAHHYYKDWKSFWIEYNPGGVKELSLESAKWHLPYVRIQLGNQNPVTLRAMLLKYLPEREQERSLTDAIIRILGF